MWAQPPAMPPPSHYAPPQALQAPVPRDPMSFPPGIIPQLVRVHTASLNVSGSSPCQELVCGRVVHALLC